MRLVSMTALLAMAACGSDGVTPPVGGIDSVTVEPQSAVVPIAGTLQLVAHALDANGAEISGAQFDWSSSQVDVMAVSSSGLVTAQGEGAATVSATASGKTGSALVYTSPQQVAMIGVEPTPLGLATGESTQLTAALSDAQGDPIAGPVVTWTSDDETVVTVSPDGVATGVATGTATITAMADGKSGTGTVAVSAAPAAVSSVTIEPGSISVAPGGGPVQLIAVAKDASGNSLLGRFVSWNSSIPAVADVSDFGLVKGVATGSAIITGTSEGVDGTAQAVVSPSSAIASITISPAHPVAFLGIPLQLTATVQDAAGNQLAGHLLRWSSSAPGRALVSQTGVVTASVPGARVAITAVAEGVIGSVSVSITFAPSVTLVVNPRR